jgi:hypothetical protein
LHSHPKQRANRFDRSEGSKTLTGPLTANPDLQGERAARQAGKLNDAEFARHCDGGRTFVPRAKRTLNGALLGRDLSIGVCDDLGSAVHRYRAAQRDAIRLASS